MFHLLKCQKEKRGALLKKPQFLPFFKEKRIKIKSNKPDRYGIRHRSSLVYCKSVWLQCVDYKRERFPEKNYENEHTMKK